MSFSSYFAHKTGGDNLFSVEAPNIKFGCDSLNEVLVIPGVYIKVVKPIYAQMPPLLVPPVRYHLIFI